MFTKKSISRIFSVLFALALTASAFGVNPVRAGNISTTEAYPGGLNRWQQDILEAAAITPVVGNWSGTTNQGQPMSFSVSSSGTQWSTFTLALYVPACGFTMTTYSYGPGAITNGQFNGSESSGTYIFAGTFTSTTTASGTFSYINYSTPCGALSASGTWTASISLPPAGDFTKSAPANGAVDQPANVRLTWGVSNNAVSYEYCVDKTDDSDCETSWIPNAGNSVIPTPSLDGNTPYYWQVRAVNGNGVTTEADGGTWHSFTTAISLPPAGDFMKSAPANGAIAQPTNVTLAWGVSSNAVSYEYCVDTSDDSDCDTPWVPNADNNVIPTPSLDGSTTYYWQVRAVNGDGVTTDADGGIWHTFTTAATSSACVPVTQIPSAECNALVALFNGTHGAGWTTNTGWLQTNTPCSWFGVQCASGTNVTALDLTYNGLSGTIPPELGNLTNLTSLELDRNYSLSGSIPPELGSLTNLTKLNLYTAMLTGSIPQELGDLTNLTYLNLDWNQLTGSIPPELGSLTKLTYLNLDWNHLTGSIPPELGTLTNLTNLRLSRNELSGSIPPELGSLSNLTDLRLGSNQLTGSIPPELGSLTNLTYLYLYENQLTGSIPTQLGSLTQLTFLDLSSNQLTGSIPPELGSLTNLWGLSLNTNQLTGSIPPELGNLTNLSGLYLNNNQLTGSILPELGNLIFLYELKLDNNQLTGSIPPELGSLTILYGLSLNGNQLSGSIPTQLGDLTNLTNLYLDNTNLTGEIPVSFTNLTSLVDLTLSCGLTSTNPTVINFITGILGTGWDVACSPVNLKSIGAQDGWTLESGENTNVGGSMNATASAFRLGDDSAKKQYRSILSFATGTALPDNAVITKVTLKLKLQTITGGGNPVTMFQGFMIDLKKGSLGMAALQTTDFQAVTNKTLGPILTAASSGWYTFDLTSAKATVNKLATLSGLTQIRLRFKLDDNNNTVANYLNLYSGNAGVAFRPQLIIEYHLP